MCLCIREFEDEGGRESKLFLQLEGGKNTQNSPFFFNHLVKKMKLSLIFITTNELSTQKEFWWQSRDGHLIEYKL